MVDLSLLCGIHVVFAFVHRIDRFLFFLEKIFHYLLSSLFCIDWSCQFFVLLNYFYKLRYPPLCRLKMIIGHCFLDLRSECNSCYVSLSDMFLDKYILVLVLPRAFFVYTVLKKIYCVSSVLRSIIISSIIHMIIIMIIIIISIVIIIISVIVVAKSIIVKSNLVIIIIFIEIIPIIIISLIVIIVIIPILI